MPLVIQSWPITKQQNLRTGFFFFLQLSFEYMYKLPLMFFPCHVPLLWAYLMALVRHRLYVERSTSQSSRPQLELEGVVRSILWNCFCQEMVFHWCFINKVVILLLSLVPFISNFSAYALASKGGRKPVCGNWCKHCMYLERTLKWNLAKV